MIVVNVDMNTLRPIERRLASAGNQAPHAIRRGLNKTGDQASTPYVRAIAKAIGVKVGVVRKRTERERANYRRLEYRLAGFGGPIPLIYFNARETRAGVSATPNGQRKVFKGSFIKGGRFPNRKPLKIGPQVWQRGGKARLPIEKQVGLAVPDVMLKSPAVDTFRSVANAKLLPNILHEVDAIINGWVPRL